jgi:putative FmdB family regulatory protein
MPIYEYRCASCGHELEALQKFSDAPLLHCPSCKADTLVKLVSAAGFQLKGSGWYATDFKGSGTKPPATKGAGETKADAKGTAGGDAGGAGDGKGAAKDEAKGESKADAKADAKPAAPASGGGAPPAAT